MSGWVCPECGLDYDTIAPTDTPVAIRSYPRRFRELIIRPDQEGDDPLDVVRRKPDTSTWSALEYTAHVRDLCGEMAEAIRRMNVEDNPTIDFADPDALAAKERYNEQDPEAVLNGLSERAERLAKVLESVKGDGWTRTGAFPWGERDILTMARNAVHEGHHHLRDVERVLAATR